MATPAASLIMTKTRIIDGLSIRYAESAPREVSAILLSPWPESLYTFEQMWPRLAEHGPIPFSPDGAGSLSLQSCPCPEGWQSG